MSAAQDVFPSYKHLGETQSRLSDVLRIVLYISCVLLCTCLMFVICIIMFAGTVLYPLPIPHHFHKPKHGLYQDLDFASTAPHLLNSVLLHRCRYNGWPTCHRVRSTCIDCSFFALHVPKVIQELLGNRQRMHLQATAQKHTQQSPWKAFLSIWHFRRAWCICPCAPGHCQSLCWIVGCVWTVVPRL